MIESGYYVFVSILRFCGFIVVNLNLLINLYYFNCMKNN